MSFVLNKIRVDRESVCMGDDFNAPNEELLDLDSRDMFSDVLKKVAHYLPQMSDVIWAVDTGKKVLGYVIMDQNCQHHFELCQHDKLFSEMGIRVLHCSYFHSHRFMHNVNGVITEKFPEQKSLLEKVKYCMNERFLEELQIEGGSLCIWGEWFGRPYDNFHIVESVRWERTKITINFDQGESLYISNPIKIANQEKKLLIGDALKVLFVWYEYGKEHTYDNMYVRQYTKSEDGKILRAEGKRRDVSNRDGIVFQPLGENAVNFVNPL